MSSRWTTNGGTIASESPDGRFIYFAKDRGDTGIWRIPKDGDNDIQVISHQ